MVRHLVEVREALVVDEGVAVGVVVIVASGLCLGVTARLPVVI